MEILKLYMLMLGCKPPGRHTEQHDVFFGIAASLPELVPQIKDFWPEPERIHIDAWREVNSVEGYKVSISKKDSPVLTPQNQRLFFINLGGYQENKFQEQHYTMLTIQENSSAALTNAKSTLFFRQNYFEGANTHIDDKYGIDVDDIYQIEDIIPGYLKEKYRIDLLQSAGLADDPIHIGFLRLSSSKTPS
jgi:hypothetical protein